jgi:hypothetical protein
MLKRFLLVLMLILIALVVVGCIPLIKVAKYGVQEVVRKKEGQNNQQTRDRRLATAVANGKKDFATIKPFYGNSFQIEIAGDYIYDPKCKDVFYNIPAISDLSNNENLTEFFKQLRNVSKVKITPDQISNGNQTKFLKIIEHEQGTDVIETMFGYYVNGKCFIPEIGFQK